MNLKTIFQTVLFFSDFVILMNKNQIKNILFFPKRHDYRVAICFEYMPCFLKHASLFNVYIINSGLSDLEAPQALQLRFNSGYGLNNVSSRLRSLSKG